MYCRKCGSLIEDGAKFCENCGAPIPAGASMAEGTGGSVGSSAAERYGSSAAAGTGGFDGSSDSGGKFPGGRKALIIILVIVIAAVCGGLAAFVLSPGYSAEYKDKLEEAQKYVSNEDFENAELTYKGLIELEPKEERAYFELSDLYVEQTRYDEALDTLELGKTNTGGSDKFDKEIKKVKASMGKGKGKATESEKTGDAQILKLYSDHMSGIFQGFKYLDSVTNIDVVQQTYVYDPNDDMIPDVLAYSYLDHNEDYSYNVSHNGFCTVDNGKLIHVPIEGTLSGLAVIESRQIYASPDRTVYLWDSKSSSNGNVDVSIKKYELKSGKYNESILKQGNLPYEEVEDMYSNINEYIPADAEHMIMFPTSPHTTRAWNSKLDETARFLSMFDISILPAGTWGKDWKKAYQDYFGKLQKDIDDSPDNASVQMASEDVNGDGIPEIFLKVNYNSGTVNGGSLQCYTFANGRVVPFPTRTGDIKDVTELFPGGRDIRIDKKEKKIYYDGITGGYGNDQLQYICHVGHNGFVIDESFESRQVLWVDTLELVTTHNFQELDGEEMSSIFSNETFNGKTQLSWQNVPGGDTLAFIKNL